MISFDLASSVLFSVRLITISSGWLNCCLLAAGQAAQITQLELPEFSAPNWPMGHFHLALTSFLRSQTFARQRARWWRSAARTWKGAGETTNKNSNKLNAGKNPGEYLPHLPALLIFTSTAVLQINKSIKAQKCAPELGPKNSVKM